MAVRSKKHGVMTNSMIDKLVAPQARRRVYVSEGVRSTNYILRPED